MPVLTVLGKHITRCDELCDLGLHCACQGSNGTVQSEVQLSGFAGIVFIPDYLQRCQPVQFPYSLGDWQAGMGTDYSHVRRI